MNFSTAIFLVRDDIRAVAVSYDVDAEGKGLKPYTLFKTPDPDVKPGEYVIIPTDTRHRMTVVRVEEVDVEVDLDSGKHMDWLIGGVDRSTFETIAAKECEIIETIKSAEKRKKQDDLRDKLLADNPDLAAFNTIDVPALAAPS